MNARILIVLLVGIMSKFTQGDWVKKPMGIKMCERECQCLKGCYAIQYDTVSMQCTTLVDPKDEVKGSPSLITKAVPTVQDSSLSCRPEICPEGERSVLNRHHKHVCIPSEVLTPKVQQDCRLLVVSQSLDRSVAFEMNLVTGQFQKHPFYWRFVRELVIVGKEMKLLMLTIERRVMTVSNNQSVVWRDVRNVMLMCADGRRNILFVVTFSTYRFNHIYRMTTAGQRKRRILGLPTRLILYALDVDPDQQKVYIMLDQGVVSVGYDGSNKNYVYTSEVSGVEWLQYNIEYKEMYYYDYNTNAIKANSVGGTRLVLKTDLVPKQKHIHDRAMYFSSKVRHEFYSVDVRGGEHALRTHVLPEHFNDGELLLSNIVV